MREPGTCTAFDDAERLLISLIRRAGMQTKIAASYRPIDPNAADLHHFMATEDISMACGIVDWCYDQEYLTRSETFNIKHWLHWFNDPEFFDYWKCAEDFRYE